MYHLNMVLKRIILPILLIFFLAVFSYGCATPSLEPEVDRALPDGERPGDYVEEVDRGEPPVQEGIHKISRAEVNLEVEDLEDSLSRLEEKARDMGGFVSYSSINKRERDPSAQVTLRIPEDKFYNMLEEIEKIGEVEHRSTSEEDVTRRYIDLEARIDNLTAQEERLTEIMQMAETVEEVLSVERELERVRGEIESLTGEFNYLRSQVSMATINIRLRERVLAATGVTSIDFRDMFTRGYYALIDSINALILFARGVFILAMGSLPYIILLAILLLILRKPYRAIKEKRQRGKTPPDKSS